jgi:hypothetical protein
MSTKNKVYSMQTLKGGLHWFFDIGKLHLTMRLAGNPSLVLEYYIKKYWEKGKIRYLEMLEILKQVWDEWKSPFVMYVNERKDD